jgi:hypothetical protein
MQGTSKCEACTNGMCVSEICLQTEIPDKGAEIEDEQLRGLSISKCCGSDVIFSTRSRHTFASPTVTDPKSTLGGVLNFSNRRTGTSSWHSTAAVRSAPAQSTAPRRGENVSTSAKNWALIAAARCGFARALLAENARVANNVQSSINFSIGAAGRPAGQRLEFEIMTTEKLPFSRARNLTDT